MLMFYAYAPSLERHLSPAGIMSLYWATGISGSLLFLCIAKFRYPAVAEFVSVIGSSAATYGMNVSAGLIVPSEDGSHHQPFLFLLLPILPQVARRLAQKIRKWQDLDRESPAATPTTTSLSLPKISKSENRVLLKKDLWVGSMAALLFVLSNIFKKKAEEGRGTVHPSTSFALYVGYVLLGTYCRQKLFHEYNQTADHASHAGGGVIGYVAAMGIIFNRRGSEELQKVLSSKENLVTLSTVVVLLGRLYYNR